MGKSSATETATHSHPPHPQWPGPSNMAAGQSWSGVNAMAAPAHTFPLTSRENGRGRRSRLDCPGQCWLPRAIACGLSSRPPPRPAPDSRLVQPPAPGVVVRGRGVLSVRLILGGSEDAWPQPSQAGRPTCQAPLRRLPGDQRPLSRCRKKQSSLSVQRAAVCGPQSPAAALLAMSAVGVRKIKPPFVSRFCIESGTCQGKASGLSLFCLSVSLSHTHTHTHTHARMEMSVHAQKCGHMHTHSCTPPSPRGSFILWLLPTSAHATPGAQAGEDVKLTL